jgi:hypothetical protein
MDKTSTGFENVVMLADKDIVKVKDFAVMREGKDGKKPFIGLVNAEDLNKEHNKYNKKGEKEDREHQVYVCIVEMLAVLLEAAVGKDVSDCSIVDNSFDEDKDNNNIIRFLPMIEIMKYELLVDRYRGFLEALQSA